MKFLTSGCSFTGPAPSGWPNWLMTHGFVKNVAQPAAGNKYISDSIIHELAHADYDCVLVMWSGLQRIDILVDDLAPFKSCKLAPDVKYYLAGDIIDNKFSNIIKISNEKSRAYSSLMEIIKLQSFLKSKNKTYYFMSYVNYWNDQDHLINRNFGIYKYPILETLAKLIDFSRFIFGEDNECLYEYALKHNSFTSDNFHPGFNATDKWVSEVIEPRLKKDNIC